MNKLTIVALAILFINAINADTCSRCIAPDAKIPTHYGEDILCVNINIQTYENGTYNCAYLPTFGEECYSPCGDGYSCFGNKCVAGYYKDIGAKCTVNYECINNYCENNTCAQQSNCEEQNEQCPWNQYCNANNECVPKEQLGDDCVLDSDCNGGLICYSGKCKKAYSIEEGEGCDAAESNQCDVTKNLFCKNINKQVGGATCQTLVPTSPSVQCNGSDPICSFNEYCDCASNSCKPILVLNKNTPTVSQNFYDCAIKNKCHLSSAFIPQSCLGSKCAREYCEYDLYNSRECSNTKLVSSCKKFYTKSESSEEPSSANVVKASFILLILSIILSF